MAAPAAQECKTVELKNYLAIADDAPRKSEGNENRQLSFVSGACQDGMFIGRIGGVLFDPSRQDKATCRLLDTDAKRPVGRADVVRMEVTSGGFKTTTDARVVVGDGGVVVDRVPCPVGSAAEAKGRGSSFVSVAGGKVSVRSMHDAQGPVMSACKLVPTQLKSVTLRDGKGACTIVSETGREKLWDAPAYVVQGGELNGAPCRVPNQLRPDGEVDVYVYRADGKVAKHRGTAVFSNDGAGVESPAAVACGGVAVAVVDGLVARGTGVGDAAPASTVSRQACMQACNVERKICLVNNSNKKCNTRNRECKKACPPEPSEAKESALAQIPGSKPTVQAALDGGVAIAGANPLSRSYTVGPPLYTVGSSSDLPSFL